MEKNLTERVCYLIKRLPAPLACYKISGAAIEIYRAKNLLANQWNNKTLRELTLIARKSYHIYGPRPLLDKYDQKAAIYLARVISDSPWPAEEWLSVRLVPFVSPPLGTGEADIFTYKGRVVDYWIQKKLFNDNPNFYCSMASSSRMCGIHPYFQRKSDEEMFCDLSKEHKYTAFCYALINYHFLGDYLERFSFSYITGVIHDKFVDSALTVKSGGKSFGVSFIPAYRQLGIKNPKDIKLDTRSSDYFYRYPGYWFDMRQLICLLKQLIVSGRLTEETLAHYLGAKWRQNLNDSYFIGKLLISKERLKFSPITGGQLRQMVDDHVAVVPELKITAIETLRKSIQKLFAAAKVK